MTELGQHPGDGSATDPDGLERVVPDAVARMELRRSRQAVFGTAPHPRAARFASRLAAAVEEGPHGPGEDGARREQPRRTVPVADSTRTAERRPTEHETVENESVEDASNEDARHEDESWAGPGAAGVNPALQDAVFGDMVFGDMAAGRPVLAGSRPAREHAAVGPVASGRSAQARMGVGQIAGHPSAGHPIAGHPGAGLPAGRGPDGAGGSPRGTAVLLPAPTAVPTRPPAPPGSPAGLPVGPPAGPPVGPAAGPPAAPPAAPPCASPSPASPSPASPSPASPSGPISGPTATSPGPLPPAGADRGWTAELERLARVGTWSFDLATGILQRSQTLHELYRSVGVDPETAGAGPIEGEQVSRLCHGLRAGSGRGGPGDARSGPGAPSGPPLRVDHHTELRLPGGRRLSCRAEVEWTPNGAPSRLVGVVRDVTVQWAAQGRAEHSGQRFVDLMTMVPAGVGLLDPSGRIVDANPALCALLDVSLERLRGAPAGALDAESTGGAPSWLRTVPPGARFGYTVEAAPLRRGDGTTVWCELAVSATPADEGGWFWLVVCTDVSEQRRAAELLRRAGTVDELTRLPNRAASLELVDRLLARPDHDRVAVVCGDLDDFARVNSSLGHDVGDDLLVSLAGRLQRELPVGCTAARLSGDEFVVICADHAEVGGPDQLARTVADLLRTTITVHGQPVQLTASVGLATPVPLGEVRAADLLRFAEVAMHDVKRRQCRGGIGMATDGVVSSATRALELEAELQAAIAADGLVLDYQPVVGPDGTVLSAEALVRWPHPERGLIPPGDFLPVAQRCGLLRELDLWVLGTAVREAVTWPGAPAVAVNLAGLLPGDADFLTVVTGIVEAGGLAWDRLVLELVETSLVALPPQALAAMAALVARGVRFAVDDFGTGYSSLARLKELPAQIIKVDRAFVTGIAEDPADFAVARAVVDMARAMGRTTVAEGVETVEQFHVLRGIGVDAFQGWLFARPLAPAALRERLSAGRIATPATGEQGL